MADHIWDNSTNLYLQVMYSGHLYIIKIYSQKTFLHYTFKCGEGGHAM